MRLRVSGGFRILLPLIACVAYAMPALDPATDTAEQFFGLDKVYTFHLTLTPAEYKKLEPPNGPGMARPGVSGDDRYPTSTAILEFEGHKWGQLNLRYKGNSSYRSAGGLKRPIKLEFEGSGDTKDKSRAFFGMAKLNLNNNAMDASQMREALGYDIFRRAGVTAVRTAFAKVFLTVPGLYDRQYAGLYTVVEQIDQAFFKDRFGQKTGPVAKPEGLDGMPYLGNDWNKYLISYGVKSTEKVDPEQANRLVAFVRFVNQATDDEFAKHVDDYVDVEEFLRFLAVEVAMVNLDSPLGMNHNYYLALNPKTQRIFWIPWDLNLAFAGLGGRGDGSAVPQQDLSIHKPAYRGQFPLADRVLAVPALLSRYDVIVRELVAKNFTTERLGAQMELMANAIRNAVKDDPSLSMVQFERHLAADPSKVTMTESKLAADGGFTVIDPNDPPGLGFGGFGRGRRPGANAPPLRQFVTLRVESVLEQLDGKREGFTSTGRGGGRFGGGFGPPVPAK